MARTKKRETNKAMAKQIYFSTIRYVGFLIICSVILSGLIIWISNDVFAFVKADASFTIVVTKDNATAVDIASDLQTNGIIKHKMVFSLYAVLTGDNKLEPGTYNLDSSMGYETLLNTMGKKHAERATVDVTIPEGMTLTEAFKILEEKGVCTADKLQKSAENDDFNYSFIADLPNGKNRLEGYLFPDTYTFYVDDDPARVINKFLSNFSSKFDSTLKDRAQKQGLTMRQVLIVASMVENEAKLDEDRPVIASVIYNRLNSRNFKYLQVDATIQYALGVHKETLTSDDLKIDSPYNTYTHEGLTPGPICSPGIAAIRAALYPAKTHYYYYVAKKDGSHIFSETAAEHAAAVKRAKEG